MWPSAYAAAPRASTKPTEHEPQAATASFCGMTRCPCFSCCASGEAPHTALPESEAA
jgi:hypothetical protein